MTHLYTLIVETDGTYEVLLDEVSKASGKLSEEWAFPSESIKDPEQSKPTDWVDTKMIEDPEAKKPEGELGFRQRPAIASLPNPYYPPPSATTATIRHHRHHPTLKATTTCPRRSRTRIPRSRMTGMRRMMASGSRR